MSAAVPLPYHQATHHYHHAENPFLIFITSSLLDYQLYSYLSLNFQVLFDLLTIKFNLPIIINQIN